MSATDNNLIAAHLAAALISKFDLTSLPAKGAVTMYFDVLKALEDEQAARHSAGTDPPLGYPKEDITAAVAASKVEEPKDNYSSDWDDADRPL